jgi:hypothetical protein
MFGQIASHMKAAAPKLASIGMSSAPVLAFVLAWRLTASTLARSFLAVAIIAGVAVAPLITKQRALLAGILICSVPLPVSMFGGVSLQPLLLLPAGLLLLAQARERSLRPQRLDVFLLSAVVLAAALASVVSPRRSIDGLVLWLAFAVWGLAVAQVGRRIDPSRLIAAISLAGLVAAAFSVLGSITGLTIFGRDLAVTSVEVARNATALRFAGSLGDYELYAEMMAITACLCTWLASTSSLKMMMVWLGGAVLAVTQLLLTGTRSSLALAAAGIVTILLTASRSQRKVLIGLSAVTASILLSTVVEAALQETRLLPRVGRISFDAGLATSLNRQTAWVPFVETYDPFGSFIGNGPTYPYTSIGFYPHSLPLYLGYTLGLAGMVALMGVLVLALAHLLRASSRRSVGAVPLSVALSVFLVDQLKVEFPRIDAYSMWVASLLGVAMAVGAGVAPSTALRSRVR